MFLEIIFKTRSRPRFGIVIRVESMIDVFLRDVISKTCTCCISGEGRYQTVEMVVHHHGSKVSAIGKLDTLILTS